ncbi:MAG TPA: zinc ribbon domain-containing protein [Ktedonobacterales bacterium]|nr:zinc ribbon domain-containing protein [Ktedonobacterales bacterium]
MGPGASVSVCPRCGTSVPANARFCRNCGLTLTAAMGAPSGPPEIPTFAAGYGPSATDDYPSPGAGYAAQDDRWAAQGASGQGQYSYQYPVGDYNDYDPEAHKPKGSFWRSLWGVLVISSLIMLVLGVSAFALYYYPSLCTAGSRNGLRNDIALPCGLTYQNQLDRSDSATGKGSKEWIYTVDSMSPPQIKSFYESKLPDGGWTISTAAAQSSQVPPGGLIGCKGPTAALIYGTQGTVQEGDFAFSPPPQGSVLIIILIPISNGSLPTGICPGS